MGKPAKIAIVNSFIYASFIGILVLVNWSKKLRKSKNVAWESCSYESDYDILLRTWKSNNGNKAIKNSGQWNFQGSQ